MPELDIHLPQGRDIARVLRLFAHRQLAEVLQQLERGSRRVNLHHWQGPIVEATVPHVLHYYQQAARRTMRRIAGKLASSAQAKAFTDRTRTWYVVKGNPARPPLFRRVLDLFSSQVLDRVKQTTQAVVQSILDTVTAKVNKVIEAVFGKPRDGAAGPVVEAGKQIAEVMLDNDRHKAAASDLAVRTTMMGLVAAAQQSGVAKRVQWVAVSDSRTCETCLLLDGEVRDLGEPFIVWPGGGEFSRVYYPPCHPWCRCGLLVLVDDRLVAA